MKIDGQIKEFKTKSDEQSWIDIYGEGTENTLEEILLKDEGYRVHLFDTPVRVMNFYFDIGLFPEDPAEVHFSIESEPGEKVELFTNGLIETPFECEVMVMKITDVSGNCRRFFLSNEFFYFEELVEIEEEEKEFVQSEFNRCQNTYQSDNYELHMIVNN